MVQSKRTQCKAALCAMYESELFRVFHLGTAFLLIFSAYNSARFIQEIVIDSYAYSNETGGGGIDPHAGYFSPSIMNAALLLSVLFVPAVVTALGPKWSMVAGAMGYVFYVANFLVLTEWLLYVASATQGFGGAVLWTAQGKYLTLSSDSETMARNSGITWALFRGGIFVGGFILYFVLDGAKRFIPLATITLLYSIFVACMLAGAALLALLREPVKPASLDRKVAPLPLPAVSNGVKGATVDCVSDRKSSSSEYGACNGDTVKRPAADAYDWTEHMLGTIRLVFTKHMLLLSVVFCYTGFEQSFWIGVYPTCLGFTDKFPTEGNTLVAYHAWCVATGEVIGGGAFGVMGHRFNRCGRNVVVLTAFVLHAAAFYVIFLNMPGEAPLHHTDAVSYIAQPNVYLALACSFVFGLCNALWNTQIYSLIGSLYSDKSAQSFAIYRFFQSATACANLYYSSLLALHWQLLILTLWSAAAALCFFPVEFHAQRVAARKAMTAAVKSKL